VGEDWDTAQDRVTIQEAARRLGVKEDAIRKRIQRGSLLHEKTREGRVFVWVDVAQDATQATTEDAYQDASRDSLAAKDETIAALREQLTQANERDRENRRIIAALTQRIPAIEAPTEPPPSQAPPEAPTATSEQPGRVEPQSSVEGAQEPAERRSWWREFFGFGG
jgi:excisionase family DNA binding protein